MHLNDLRAFLFLLMISCFCHINGKGEEQPELSDDAVVEIEEDSPKKPSTGRSQLKTSQYTFDDVIKKVKKMRRYNQMNFIPGGVFTMGTDDIITKDGEAPARKYSITLLSTWLRFIVVIECLPMAL
ncbi:unnamed protein product [Clavelina lepadiformis]|uniref:Uncharacterized protein n=1 Tax=Clavelina lepadiformis TaxID=159417 RepID=A0ABP0G7L6_CLALP